MKLKDFLENSLNKWVKIENKNVKIIQRVEQFEQVSGKSYYLCVGTSVCGANGEIVKLDKFYTTKDHLMGNVHVIPDELAKLEIAKLEIESVKEI